MSTEEIDAYLLTLDEPKQSTLREVRRIIVGIVPEAEQCISYGMPAFRLQGKVVAGFAAFKNHLSYFPHSGSVLAELKDETAGYVRRRRDGSQLQFAVDAAVARSALVDDSSSPSEWLRPSLRHCRP